MASFQEEWLTEEDNIRDRGMFLFNNELMSDVSLVVQASRDEGEPKAKKTEMAIPAHKLVLSMCSPVFFAMFCGKMTRSQMNLRSKSVDLPDCEYEGVFEMLRYMYSGEAKLNENNVMQVLYVAKKYIVKSLADECIHFLQRNINPENVFGILSHAQQYDEKVLVDECIEFLHGNVEPENVFCVLSHAEQYDEKALVDQCWELIDRETEQVVTSEEFVTIERPLLEAIVKRDTLTIREGELFKAVDLWATKECERQGLTPDGGVKRGILGEAIMQQIRFPVMEQKHFASVVLDSEMLVPQEVCNMMKHFNSVLTAPVGFHGDRRAGAIQSCFRFALIGLNPHYPQCSTHSHCLDFYVNKDVALHGICLFGKQDSEYEVSLTLKKSCGATILVNQSGHFSPIFKRHKEVTYNGFDVMFAPVNLIRDTWFSMKVKINGPPSWHGIFGFEEVTASNGVTFSFRNCGHNSNTTIAYGQFANILFKLL